MHLTLNEHDDDDDEQSCSRVTLRSRTQGHRPALYSNDYCKVVQRNGVDIGSLYATARINT